MKERIKSLDGLKGLMCILIVFFHWPETSYFPSVIAFIKDDLSHCVELFFAISGFGMALSYKNRIKSMSFNDYIFRRMRKLYPLYFITISISCILYHVLFIEENIQSIINNILTFFCIGTGWFFDILPHNVPSWTVSILFMCYVYYYLLCKFSNSRIKYLFLIYIIIVFCSFGIYFRWNYPMLFYIRSLRCVLAFFSGVLVFEVYKDLKSFLKMYIPMVLFVFALVILLYSNIINLFFIISCLVICPLCLFLSINVRCIKYILSTSVFQLLGKMSMSVYLWHYVVQMVIVYLFHNENTFKAFVCYMLISILVAFVSMRIIEPKINFIFNRLITLKEEL